MRISDWSSDVCSSDLTKVPLAYQKVSQLSPELSTNLYNAETGTVYGPYFEGGSFKVAKLLDAANRPDSVRASHILISAARSEEHTSELQSLMRISYAVFCLKKKTKQHKPMHTKTHDNTQL